MPGFRYGALLPPLSLNLIVMTCALRCVLPRRVPDRGTLRRHRLRGDTRWAAEVMLHADHAEDHPWHAALMSGACAASGAQIRILGMDPDALEARARAAGVVVSVATLEKGTAGAGVRAGSAAMSGARVCLSGRRWGLLRQTLRE
jgi:hypothetical protein